MNGYIYIETIMKRRKWIWRGLIFLVVLILLGGGAAWMGFLPLPGSQENAFPEGEFPPEAFIQTVPVQRAEDFIADLIVSGRLALRNVNEIKAPFDETIAQASVEVGSRVAAGDLLVRLDRRELSTQLDSAWFELTKTRLALAELVEPPSDLEMLEANAELLNAQEALDKLVDGPSATETSGASVAIQEAQAAYDELLARNDPNSAKVRQARYSLRQAENGLQRAQTAYNAVSWRGDLGALAESSALQGATISFESARSAFEEATKAPTDLELKQAQLAIDRARNEYNKLFEEATPGAIEQARATVAKAEERIDGLKRGASPQKIAEAEVTVLDALTKLEDARLKLLKGSDLTAPIEGVVTKLAATVGQLVKEGDTVAVVAAPDQFELTLTVDENSILQLSEEMLVQISVDVAPDASISGRVSYIASVDSNSLSQSENDSGVSTGGSEPAKYPVTVEVDDTTVPDSLRAGMNVQVTFLGSSQLPPNSWLVPANAIEPAEEGFGTIEILRGDAPESLQVEVTKQTQGEWVVVVSEELQDGDQVLGSVSSFLNEDPFGPGF